MFGRTEKRLSSVREARLLSFLGESVDESVHPTETKPGPRLNRLSPGQGAVETSSEKLLARLEGLGEQERLLTLLKLVAALMAGRIPPEARTQRPSEPSKEAPATRRPSDRLEQLPGATQKRLVRSIDIALRSKTAADLREELEAKLEKLLTTEGNSPDGMAASRFEGVQLRLEALEKLLSLRHDQIHKLNRMLDLQQYAKQIDQGSPLAALRGAHFDVDEHARIILRGVQRQQLRQGLDEMVAARGTSLSLPKAIRIREENGVLELQMRALKTWGVLAYDDVLHCFPQPDGTYWVQGARIASVFDDLEKAA